VIETLSALLLAHMLADYLLQPGWMSARKAEPGPMLAHFAIVLATAMACLGRYDSGLLLGLAGAHILIDLLKTHLAPKTLNSHLLDQGAHLATLLALAFYAPDLWASGQWANAPNYVLHFMVLLAGFIAATRAGGFAIALLMAEQTRPQDGANADTGLPRGGLLIGQLERAMIFVLMLAGMAASIGFLIAAKSILRFGSVTENRAASEYVIIGTLASFGWAISITLLTLALRAALPPLP